MQMEQGPIDVALDLEASNGELLAVLSLTRRRDYAPALIRTVGGVENLPRSAR
jgi:hypothetical protein